MKVILFANGAIDNYSVIQSMIPNDAFIISVDGGIRHCHKLGLVPNLLIGDFDSANENELKIFPNVKTLRYPRDKDKSDLELALETTFFHPVDKVLIFGGLGYFLDHTFANLLLLAKFPPKIFFFSESETVFLIPEGSHTFDVPNKQTTLSLLPLFGPVHIEETKNLQWNIRNRTIDSSFYSLSNKTLESTFNIIISKGKILAIHSHRN